MVSLTVKEEYEDKELIDFIIEMYPDFPEKAVIKAFKSGDITLNESEAYGDDIIHAGDIVRIFLAGDCLGVELKPEIVYSDENFVIIDKPAGLLSVSQNGEPSAISIAEEYMKRRGEYSLEALMVPYMLYPLEKYVSGLMILAKHEGAYLFMAQALTQRRITRYFVCPVIGEAKEKDELLAYHWQDKAARRVEISSDYRKDSKPIVTRYTALSVGEKMSLLSVRPVTNFLHQVRAHLAFGGLPVLGDDTYGDRRFNRKCRAGHIALWLKTVIFEVGKNHEYAYLNGRKFESQNHSFPKCVYGAGLMEL